MHLIITRLAQVYIRASEMKGASAMWSSLIAICTILGSVAVFWMQRRNHLQEISRLQTTHTDEISRLEQNHSNEVSAIETAHSKAISLLESMTDKLVESAYRSGRASARPHVFEGEEHTGRWFWKMTRKLTVAVVLDEQGGVLAFAGDGSKLDSIEMPPELKKTLTALSGTAGKVIANLVI